MGSSPVTIDYLIFCRSLFGVRRDTEKFYGQIDLKCLTDPRYIEDIARTYLQLPLRQWGAGNVYLLVLSS